MAKYHIGPTLHVGPNNILVIICNVLLFQEVPELEEFVSYCNSTTVNATSLSRIVNALEPFSDQLCSTNIDALVIEKVFSIKHGQSIRKLYQGLTRLEETDRDQVAICKSMLTEILTKLHAQTFDDHSIRYFMSVVQSGLLTQAAEDAKWAFPMYRNHKVNSV